MGLLKNARITDSFNGIIFMCGVPIRRAGTAAPKTTEVGEDMLKTAQQYGLSSLRI